MPGLTIALEFLTGRCVAAEVSDRDAAEWPPHFGRVYMALAAACFELDEEEDEVAALKWLESLPAPAICASKASERSAVSVYVPMNDKNKATKSLLQTVPGMTRSKQERSFPTSLPDDPVVNFVWDDAPGVEEHLDALDRVCGNAIRVGHSSSLVRVWATADTSDGDPPTWVPTDGRSSLRTRVVGTGEFERLRVACNAEWIEQFGELSRLIESSKGKVKTEAKKVFEEAFGETWKASLRPPEPTPPVLGMWQGYARCDAAEPREIASNCFFESQLIVLGKIEGRSLGLQDTLAVTRLLRSAAIDCADDPVPEWLSGHAEDGTSSQSPHVAFIPLPFAGYPHADGHLMGLAMVMPKQIAPEDRGYCLRHLLIDDDGNPKPIELTLGRLGIWTLMLEDADTPRRSLKNATWTRASRSWASVTPVVLDRFPKSSYAKERKAWQQEVAETIVQSCVRAGLPEPSFVHVGTTSQHEGVPRAFAKTRPRRLERRDEQETSPLGDGFPHVPSRPGKPTRPQVHVWLEFDQPVQGPVLIGAGRFVGYGFCKPLKEKEGKR